jgi:hypothetical protein
MRQPKKRVKRITNPGGNPAIADYGKQTRFSSDKQPDTADRNPYRQAREMLRRMAQEVLTEPFTLEGEVMPTGKAILRAMANIALEQDKGAAVAAQLLFETAAGKLPQPLANDPDNPLIPEHGLLDLARIRATIPDAAAVDKQYAELEAKRAVTETGNPE